MRTPKTAILETLDKMDNLQAEKALRYIRSLIESNDRYTYDHMKVKQKALLEIRSALRNDKSIGMTF